MRPAAIVLLLALTGCASWFKPEPPRVELPPIQPAETKLWPTIPAAPTVSQWDAAKGYLDQAGKAKDEAEYKRKTELAEKAAKIAREDADAAQARASKASALADVAGYCGWAIGLGVIIVLGSSLPVVGPFLAPLRQAAEWTVVLAAVIAVGAPWLSDLLGNEKVLWAGYASFAILALSAAVAGGWWLLDKARDAVNRQ